VAPDDLPPKIRAWVELFQGATLSGARSFGPHTYLVAARTGHRVRIQKVVRRTYEVPHQLDVVVELSPGGEEVAVVRIPAFQDDVYQFWAAGELLPQVHNAHGLPDVRLPTDRDAVILSPRPGQAVKSPIVVTGYARHLFEAYVEVRVRTPGGQVLARRSGSAVACCLDWGSFRFAIPVAAPPGTDLVVELGTVGGRDGEYYVLATVPVRLVP